MERLRLRACAKVNYALEVRGLREDGYHEIRTVMQSVSLADEVEIERAQEGFTLRVGPEGTDTGPLEENTARKAWVALREVSGEELAVRIRLHKRIPSGAGLGGGSADAAATLYGLNALFDLDLDAEALREVGSRIGADVPFCLAGGTALAEGVGDVLTSLPAPPTHHLVLVKPQRGAKTAEMYRAYDARPRRKMASVEPVVAALRSADLPALAGAVGNDLEPVTGELVPEVQACREELLRCGALGAAMSGTGTAVYGIFGDDVVAEQPRAAFSCLCEPLDVGVEIV
ncbi:MAG: 4-(cytidine 5'-diphospho)-2-C-methyl-D-erythritol kinase [Actinomycetota bacterium]|nr:4-(cytidine 5'-diphospho)-2-C-methyl-D-erythritol kinase [Actinomycetota bacterium]